MGKVFTNLNKNLFSKSLINSLSNEQLLLLNNPNTIIDFLLTLDEHTIYQKFKHSSTMLQNAMWKYDMMQRVLILGNKDLDKVKYRSEIIYNIDDLLDITKSPSIKKDLYKNKYFMKIVTMNPQKDYEDLTYLISTSFDREKVFNAMINSDEFKSKSNTEQFMLIDRFNSYKKTYLYPSDFRSRYDNIEPLLIKLAWSEYPTDNIVNQLNQDELLFLEIYRHKKGNYSTLKQYLVEHLQDKSYEEVYEELKVTMKKKIEDYKWFNLSKYDYNLDRVMGKVAVNLDDEIANEKIASYMTDRLSANCSIDKDLIYSTVKRNLDLHMVNAKMFDDLSSDYQNKDDKDIRVMFYIKFGLFCEYNHYLHGFTFDQLSKINVKHIKNLYNLINDNTQDEYISMYAQAIKMYFIFGYERSLEILNGEYGEIDKVFYSNISKTNVSNVPMKQEGSKYIPVIEPRFINLMFKSKKENNFIDMLKDTKGTLNKNWYKLYNSYDDIYNLCHKEVTVKKVASILESGRFLTNNKMTPDCYQMWKKDFINNIILGNINNHTDDEVVKTAIEIHKQIQERIESSIPYVEGQAKYGYTYKTARLDDSSILDLGYRSNNCMRILGVGHNHLLHAALCRNGRLLYIYDKNNNLVAYSTAKRNGNVLILNSIELVGKLNKSIRLEDIKLALTTCVENIVNITKKSDEPIKLVCIGSANFNLFKTPFPDKYETPTIYEKEDEVYCDTDCYHGDLFIVYKDRNFYYEDIYKKDPEVSYMDPREEVKTCYRKDRYQNIDDVMNIINSIEYKNDPKNYKEVQPYMLGDTIYYNKDWYISTSWNQYIGVCLKNDPRAIEEYNDCIDYIKMLEQSKKKFIGPPCEKYKR